MDKPSAPDLVINDSDIAIIGMSGRFPGAEDVKTFWQNLRDGVEAITFFSDDELAASGVDAALVRDPNYVKASGVISDFDQFDAFFFGYSPGEAAMMDPQHRLFLECAWAALEDAGYNPATYWGLIGVYAGASMNSYLYHNLQWQQGLMEAGGGYHAMVASDKDFLATKASYKLDLKGPSVTIQTACSTSLVAVHLACQSLRNGECDIALAGGVSVRVPQRAGYLYQEGIVLSPDGHCRAFDARAGGTVIGNGVGIVALKLLADAIADGDRVLAVIKGSAINNDGSLKAGYTAPSLEAQAAVIAEAQGVAGVAADTITYVEAHGTGTVIGDPIEIAALSKAFRVSADAKGPRPELAEGLRPELAEGFCAVGSVKTNIGHLDAAAGVAGLIKATLALQEGQIPPSLNYEQPNPRIDFENNPFYVNTTLRDWPRNGGPRRAGVSSFGIGGTNAHAVLEEAPALEPSSSSRSWQLLLLAARTEPALDAATANLAAHLAQQPELPLADVAYTLQVGRKVFEHRRMLVCQDAEEAQAALSDLSSARVLASYEEATQRPVAFMFTGQGAQYVNMGLELYQNEPAFHETVDECCDLLKPHLGLDLRDVLYPNDGEVEAATEQLTQTALTQPALFVIEYALARLWMAWGVRPQALIGHSIGEYTAACLAGVFSLQDALALVAARGRLMQGLPGGAMLSVPLTEDEVLPYLGAALSVGVVNGPERCVVSGPTEAVEALERRLSQGGVACRRLHTSHAFHSAMMDPILEPFAERVRGVRLNPPQIPCVSNVTGTWLTAEEATDPSYWARHLRQTVRFAEGVQRLLEEPGQVLLEVGPGRTLNTLATRHPAKATEQVVLSSLRHPQDQQSDVAFTLTTLGRLWLAGVAINWAGFYAHERRLRVALPTYPFERQRYWLEAGARKAAAPRAEPVAVRKENIADWFYVPSWKRAVASAYDLNGIGGTSPWLVFADEGGLGAQLVERLAGSGQGVVVVQAGDDFAEKGADHYTLRPGRPEDYEALLEQLREKERLPRHVVHLWNVTSDSQTAARLEALDRCQELSFYSLLYLAQALGKQNVTEALQLTVISNGLQEVTGGEALWPEKATLLGPVHIIPHEYPFIRCRSVDVTWPQENGGAEGLVGQLLAEFAAESVETVVAYRGSFRWVQTFEPLRLERSEAASPRLKEGGVYLITGGLGGMGFVLARHLAQAARARLVLLDLAALPPVKEWEGWLAAHGEEDATSRKMRQVQELQALGAEVCVVGADVGDLAQMQAAVAQARERFDWVDGVIHAAGLPGGGMIQLRTREMAQRVLDPKVRGTLVLDAVLQDTPLDFMLLCSSINTVAGRVGQVDYVAANAFLDAFAHQSAAVRCINWETWRDVGMAARLAQGESAPSKKVAHPLLDRCVSESEAQDVYATDFTVSGHWALHEHGILGKPTLPGTTYLEMARAAFEARSGNGSSVDLGHSAVEIRDVYFLTPLIVEEGEQIEARTVLKKQDRGFSFSVLSRSGEAWQEHARGSIAALDGAAPARRALDEIERRCDEQEIADPLAQSRLGGFDLQRRTILRGLSARGEPLAVDAIVIAEQNGGGEARSMEFGPRWHSLRRVKLGAREGLALLELPSAFRADLQAYQLHPALLDFATSFLRLFKSEGSYLPLSYKRLRMKGPLPGRVYSYVRFKDDAPTPQGVTLRFDVTLLDEQGTELVEIEEFAVMRIDDVGKLGALSRTPALLQDGGGPDARSDLLAEDLRGGLSSAEGVEVFERVLGSALPRVVVSTRDLPARIEAGRAYSTALLDGATQGDATPKVKHPRPKLMNAYAPPRNETEQKLADIWQNVLGIEQVGVHDNFFELGGDSLLVTQIHSRFVESFGTDVSVANLLQYPTIADLAQFLSEQDEAQEPSFEQVHQRTSQQKEAMKRRRQKMKKRS
jgi:acyl transferase domain-containing protein